MCCYEEFILFSTYILAYAESTKIFIKIEPFLCIAGDWTSKDCEMKIRNKIGQNRISQISNQSLYTLFCDFLGVNFISINACQKCLQGLLWDIIQREKAYFVHYLFDYLVTKEPSSNFLITENHWIVIRMYCTIRYMKDGPFVLDKISSKSESHMISFDDL